MNHGCCCICAHFHALTCPLPLPPCKIKRRFNRCSYPGGLLQSPTVLQALLNLLVVKVNDLHMSEGTHNMLLAAKRQDYRLCKHTAHLADL